MKPWHPSLSDYWYVVARSRAVAAKPVAVSLLDTHVALARTASGNLIALEDRCPHRHAPLSAGCVFGQHLTCPYHGWSFDGEGHLREVPGLPADAALPKVQVRTFATCEIDGLIWLRPSVTGSDKPSGITSTATPGTRRFLWQTRLPGNIVDAMENHLDPLHTHFIHSGWVRSRNRRVPTTASFQRTQDGFTVDYRGAPAQSGWLYRLFESERLVERAQFCAAGSTRLEYAYANGSRVLIDLHFTPVSTDTTDVFVVLHVQGHWAPAWAIRSLAGPLLKRVNRQDAQILRLQAANKRRFEDRRGASTSLDIVHGALEQFWTEGCLPPAGEQRVVNMML